MQHTYIIPEVNMPKLQEEVDKLNKRAKRLKVQTISTEVTGTAYREFEWCDSKPGAKPFWWSNREVTLDAEGNKVVGPLRTRKDDNCKMTGRIRDWVYVEVIGDTPKFAGWTLTGVLEPLTLDDGSAENVVRTVPGHTVPAEYRNRVGMCDHCNTVRRRNETFVVQHEDGHYKMVGRQCIRDFLGHKSPHSLASMAEILIELSGLCENAGHEDWLGGGSYVPNSWSLLHFLTVTSAIIRKEGWVSKSKAQEYDKTPTASYITYYLSPPPASSEAYNDWRKYTAEIGALLEDPKYEQEAQAAIDWCKELQPQDGEDYLYNINLVARASYVKDKTVGMAASILMAYRRAMGLTEERKPRPESQHVGKVGDKLELDVTCHKVISTEGMYGTTGIHKLSDNNGNDLTWFASGSTTWLDEGAKYTVKGTVKAHDEYKGRKQTVLTRVKIVKGKSVESLRTTDKDIQDIEHENGPSTLSDFG